MAFFLPFENNSAPVPYVESMNTLLIGIILCSGLAAAQDAKSLPEVKDLQARAVANFHKSEKDRERYICTERIENDELDSKGTIKKRHLRERELFYVNGFAVSQDISKDGQALKSGDKSKEDARVKAEIDAASVHKKPKEQGIVVNAGDIVKLATLTNERRIPVSGRPTIVFDVVSDPAAKADNFEQKLVRAMEGTISIDEATGNIQDVDTHGVRDVKMGGGVLLNVHKGYRTHMLVAPQGKEGIWILVLAEGSGNGRAGLFLTGGVTFKQETLGCKVFDVNAEAKTKSDSIKKD